MGDSVYAMGGQLTMSVEPTGLLASKGWMPGTWAKYSATPLTFSGAMVCVDRSDGEGTQAGFLMTGPQHNQPVELLSDMWTTDKRQRPGGETRADWTAFDAGAVLDFDKQIQLQRMGSRIVAMCLPNEGIFKIYVFEVVDLAERTVPGTGAPLVYAPGAKLYVSDRGLFTSEKEGALHPWVGWVVARYASDVEGRYIVIAEAVA
jgi:hypothetical protein